MQIAGIGPSFSSIQDGDGTLKKAGKALWSFVGREGLSLFSPIPLYWDAEDGTQWGNDVPALPGFENAQAIINVFDLTNQGGFDLFTGHHADLTFDLFNTHDYRQAIRDANSRLRRPLGPEPDRLRRGRVLHRSEHLPGRQGRPAQAAVRLEDRRRGGLDREGQGLGDGSVEPGQGVAQAVAAALLVRREDQRAAG